MSEGTATNHSEEPVHAELLAINEAWSRAIVSNDADQIGSFMADDWVIVSESGVASKAQFLTFITSGGLTHSAMDLVSEPRVRVYDDIAALTGRATNIAHYEGQRFDADEWTASIFARREGRWLCVLSHITPVASP